MDEQARHHADQMSVLIEQVKIMEYEIKNLIEAARDGARGSSTSIASLQPFDSISKL